MNTRVLLGGTAALAALVLAVPAGWGKGDLAPVEPAAGTPTSQSARTTVVRFFHAVESHRYAAACSLLGVTLRAETGGAACPSFLDRAALDPLVWRIVGSRAAPDGVGVVLRLGQNELDHVRMRTWLAIVEHEAGSLKIVETHLLR